LQETSSKANWKMAKLYHPDKHPDKDFAHKAMQLINEAMDASIDPEKHRKHDEQLRNAMPPQPLCIPSKPKRIIYILAKRIICLPL
jgi:curved DNA-binding protein CbpA